MADFEDKEIGEVANTVILHDIKYSWDELWDAYAKLFESPIDLSVRSLEKLGLSFGLDQEDERGCLGLVHAFKEKGVPFKVTFNKIIYGFKQKYYYSVIIHEMCHLATILSDYSNKTYNPQKYEETNGHTEEWLKRADRFNKLTNKKGETLYEIIPYLKDELSIEDMLE